MATGFMSRHCSAILLALVAAAAAALDVAVIGVIGDKAAIVAVDGGDPKTIRIGETWRKIKVISIDKARDEATLEIDGKPRVLKRGMHYRSAEGAAAVPGRQMAKLSADSRGHFIAEGTINGGHMRFLVDTGATAVAIPASDAQRLGIDYRKGTVVRMSTANGVVPAYHVKFERVKIGDIDLYSVDGVVVASQMPFALLGMSFLNRVEMRRDGQIMTMTRLY